MAILTIELENRTVELTRLFICDSYEDMVLGARNKLANRNILFLLGSKVNSIFKKKSYFLIEPKMILNEEGEENFPEFMCIGEFDSCQPLRDPEAAGSRLIVVWFEKTLPLQSFQASLSKINKSVWEKNASDYEIDW